MDKGLQDCDSAGYCMVVKRGQQKMEDMTRI